MVALPQDNYIGNAARTEGEGQAWLEALRDFVAQLGGGQADSEITVASGVVTPDRYFHRVDTEGEAASDNLDQIALTNLPDGSLICLMAENAARVNTLRHLNGTGTPGTDGEMVLNNNENFALDHAGKRIALRRKGAQWIEEARWTVFGRQLAGAADALAVRTLCDLQQATGSLTENTAPALTDLLPMTVGGNHRKVQLINVFNRLTAATALTAVAIDDEIFIYDLSAGTAKKITPVELLKVVNALTEDTTPDLANDFVVTYDASASTVKKVKPNKFARGLVPIERKTGSSVASYDFVTGIGSTYRSYLLAGRLRPATDQVILRMRISDDGGSTFENGASQYGWFTMGQCAANTSGGFYDEFDDADSEMEIFLSTTTFLIGSGAAEGISFAIWFHEPSSTAFMKRFHGDFNYTMSTGEMAGGVFGGTSLTTAAINGVQLLFSSGNIQSGDVTLYGVDNV